MDYIERNNLSTAGYWGNEVNRSPFFIPPPQVLMVNKVGLTMWLPQDYLGGKYLSGLLLAIEFVVDGNEPLKKELRCFVRKD